MNECITHTFLRLVLYRMDVYTCQRDSILCMIWHDIDIEVE